MGRLHRVSLSFNLLRLFLMTMTVFVLSCKPDNPAQVAGSIITSFSSSCSSAGPWSQAARHDTQSLIQIFEELKQKDACKDFQAILSQMSQAATAVHGAYANQAYLDYRQIEEELQELTLVLAKAKDPGLQEEISLAIVERQRDLAVARAKRTVQSDVLSNLGPNDQFSLTTNAISGHFNSLFNYGGQLSACLQQSPSAVLSLFSNLAAIGGSFASPVIGSHMSVMSSMLNQFVGFMRNYEIDQNIWKLYDSQMPQALTCGLESMTNYYCQAEDAAEIVMSQAASYEAPNEPPNNFWQGIDVVARRLPVLNNWLLSVRAGLPPQNENDASRINTVRRKRLALDTVNGVIVGNLNEKKRLIERTSDPVVKRDELINIVAELSSFLSAEPNTHSPNAGPFGEMGKSVYQYACDLAQGGDVSKCGNIPSNPADGPSTQKYIEDEIYKNHPFTIDEVLNTHWPVILQTVTNRVMNEFNEIIFIDPTIILTAAHEGSMNNVSPRESLNIIERYLIDLRARAVEGGKNYRLQLIDETLAIIVEAKEIMDRPGPFVRGNEENPLSEIYEIFQLDFGVQFISDRLSLLVENDLRDRLDVGELPGSIEEVLRSSGGEILRRLTAAGVRGLNPIKSDLDEARKLSRSNFSIFRQAFLAKIDEVILAEHRKSVEYGETVADGPERIYGQRLAHLCLLMYASGDGRGEPKWPSRESENICKGAVLFSVYPDAHSQRSIRIADLPAYLSQYNDKPRVKTRMKTCLYYNFMRSERLYEVLRPVPPGPGGGGRHHSPAVMSPMRGFELDRSVDSRQSQLVQGRTQHLWNQLLFL